MSSQTPSLLSLSLNFTKLSRGIAALLCTGFTVQLLAPKSRQYLALVAGRFIPCVWTIFTAGFLETSILQLLFSVASILVLARIVEPIWGSKEFLKFIAIVNTGNGLVMLAVLYVWYIISTFRERAGKALYHEVSGFHGIVAGCLVAVKQLIPDTEVTLVRVMKFQARHLPSLYVLLSAGLSLWLGGAVTTIPFIASGTFFAWFYLRYMQGKPGLNLRGDPSNEFRFATFFPETLHPVIDRVAGVFGRLTGLGSSETTDENAAFVLQGNPLPGSDSHEAARRRERGAKVLEERLSVSASQAAPGLGNQPDMEAPAPTEEALDNRAK